MLMTIGHFTQLREEHRKDLMRLLRLYELYRETKNTSLQKIYLEEMRLIEQKYDSHTTPIVRPS